LPNHSGSPTKPVALHPTGLVAQLIQLPQTNKQTTNKTNIYKKNNKQTDKKTVSKKKQQTDKKNRARKIKNSQPICFCPVFVVVFFLKNVR
jgi:hypothetical protein